MGFTRLGTVRVKQPCELMHDNHHQNESDWKLICYNGCPKKIGTLNFRYFDIRKYCIFWFHQVNHCLLKRMIPRSLKLLGMSSFDSMAMSQNKVIVNFLFILVTFHSGIMAFLTSIHCCPEAHWSMQTKRENLWTAIPAVNTSHRFNKIRKWLCFKNWL